MNSWEYAGRTYDCPVVLALERLRGRWKTNILWYIWNGTNRFNAICDAMPRVHRAAIARQLKSLENDGLITKTLVAAKPLHIEYTISEIGITLVPVIEQLARWGNEHGLLRRE